MLILFMFSWPMLDMPAMLRWFMLSWVLAPAAVEDGAGVVAEAEAGVAEGCTAVVAADGVCRLAAMVLDGCREAVNLLLLSGGS